MNCRIESVCRVHISKVPANLEEIWSIDLIFDGQILKDISQVYGKKAENLF